MQSKVAAVTMVREDLFFLRAWLHHYGEVLGRENCTVGALRAQAGHVSIEPALGLGGAAPERDPTKPVTSGDINKMFASADAQTAL